MLNQGGQNVVFASEKPESPIGQWEGNQWHRETHSIPIDVGLRLGS